MVNLNHEIILNRKISLIYSNCIPSYGITDVLKVKLLGRYLLRNYSVVIDHGMAPKIHVYSVLDNSATKAKQDNMIRYGEHGPRANLVMPSTITDVLHPYISNTTVLLDIV